MCWIWNTYLWICYWMERKWNTTAKSKTKNKNQNGLSSVSFLRYISTHFFLAFVCLIGSLYAIYNFKIKFTLHIHMSKKK